MKKRTLLRLDDETFWFKYGSTTAAGIICILNGIEICMLLKKLNKVKVKCNQQKTSLWLLFNLAVSDFLVGLTAAVIKIIFYLLTFRVIALSDTLIAVYGFLLFFVLRISLLTSVLNLMAMTIDRYLAIRHPFKSQAGWYRRHSGIINVVIWVVSVSFVSLHYYLYVIKFSHRVGLKYEETIFSAVILPASVAFSCCYICTVAAIRKKGKRILRASQSKTYMGYVFRREKRVTIFAGTVVLLFVICWLPLAILGIVRAMGYKVGIFIGDMIFSLAIYNSIGNPIIYFWFKTNIWQKIKTCKICQ